MSSGDAENAHPLPELVASEASGATVLKPDDVSTLPLAVEVPLDTVSVSIQELLDLRVGSILQVERSTGETFDVTVNGTAVAKGEVRVHGDRFAIRITEILNAQRLEPVEGEPQDASPSEKNS